MNRIKRGAIDLLADMRLFSRLVIRRPLRGYQLAPLRAVLRSILHGEGLEFLLVFPRQSGKNEAIAQLLAYLLNLFRRPGGCIVYGASSDALGMGITRLEEHLSTRWNTAEWTRRQGPKRRCLNRACVVFLSTHPQAASRGHTAHHLLVIDETQDQVGPHIEAVFTPMRAAHNATAVYIGTVKLSSDYLWTKKVALEREQAADGRQRVFMVTPDEVVAGSPDYASFLARQVELHGRHHPIIASEYYLEPIDGSGQLFDRRRRALMSGSHARGFQPQAGSLYVATIDVAGEDEAATDPVARLANPGRDYTVATIFDVRFPAPQNPAPGPTWHAVDVFVDQGSKHFQDGASRPALVQRLQGWLHHWGAAHIVADASGVGHGLVSWLESSLGTHRVTGFDFSGRGKKAALGADFLALVETGRFRYWTGDHDCPGSDGWWFWQQVAACTYDLPSEGQFNRDLRWGVAASHRIQTPTGSALTHDDRLISAALIAEADRLYRAGQLTLGTGRSETISGADPLGGDVY